jgi:hypothetical protein
MKLLNQSWQTIASSLSVYMGTSFIPMLIAQLFIAIAKEN